MRTPVRRRVAGPRFQRRRRRRRRRPTAHRRRPRRAGPRGGGGRTPSDGPGSSTAPPSDHALNVPRPRTTIVPRSDDRYSAKRMTGRGLPAVAIARVWESRSGHRRTIAAATFRTVESVPTPTTKGLHHDLRPRFPVLRRLLQRSAPRPCRDPARGGRRRPPVAPKADTPRRLPTPP